MKEPSSFYSNTKHDLAFAGVNAIYHYFNKKVPRRQIEEFLRRWDSHTLYREPKLPKKYNPVYCYYPRQIICADLFSFHDQAKYNDGYPYILSVIDGFTKKAWCIPMKNKSATSMLAIIEHLHQEVVGNFDRFLSDAGKEFYNRLVKEYFDKHGIQMWTQKRLNHAAFVERFQRTIELKIAKYMEHAKTQRFVDVLQHLTNSYNNSYHRSIQMTPNQAEASIANQVKIRGYNEIKYAQIKTRQPHFVKGQTVRISKLSDRFSRSYKKRFTEEIFKISEVNLTFPIPLYKVSNMAENEIIDGTFMHYELSPVVM